MHRQLLPLRSASALKSAICFRLLIPLELLPVDDDAYVTTGFESPTSPAHALLMNHIHIVFAYRGLFKMAKPVSHATRLSAFRSEVVVWLRGVMKVMNTQVAVLLSAPNVDLHFVTCQPACSSTDRTYLETGLVSCANNNPEVSQIETGEQEVDFWKFILFPQI